MNNYYGSYLSIEPWDDSIATIYPVERTVKTGPWNKINVIMHDTRICYIENSSIILLLKGLIKLLSLGN